MAAVTSDDARLLRINEILDEKVRPALMGDGGYLEVLGLTNHTLTIRYQGACGTCPSSLTGTLMAVEGMLPQEVDPELERIAGCEGSRPPLSPTHSFLPPNFPPSAATA